jgi:hypothetical protein
MSTLIVSNIHFESTGNNRIQFDGSNSYSIDVHTTNVISINSSSVQYSTDPRRYPVDNKTSVYTTVSSDKGKIIVTTANVVVNGSVFSVGDTFWVHNDNLSGSINIIPGSGTQLGIGGNYYAATNRTLSPKGMTQIIMISNTLESSSLVSSNSFVCLGGTAGASWGLS